MTGRTVLDCAVIDELAAAHGLGAVDRDEAASIELHLSTCRHPHDEARELIAAGGLVPAALAPVAPSPGLRDRLMATVAETPQDHRPVVELPRAGTDQARHGSWWRASPLASAVAAAALVAAVGFGAWGLSLTAQLSERDAALRTVATADAAYVAEGTAGRGWVIRNGGEATFVADDLAELADGRLYELWLIDATGTPVAAGTLTDTDGVAVLPLEQPLAGATTFAVTVEAERVDAPTSEPVLLAALGG